MDMAVSQYAYGKLEIMAQKGKMLGMPCGYDMEGRPKKRMCKKLHLNSDENRRYD